MPSDTIVLRFVDADSGKLMGEHPVPAGQVPESFEVATTLDIGEKKFEVVHAEPPTRAAAAERGFLTLRLRLVDIRKVDPRDLLCSLPSIADELPQLVEGLPGPRRLRLHEDDWRQVELLSPAAAELASGDLAAIADIHRTQRSGKGFRKLHVRKGVPQPLLGCEVRLTRLVAAMGPDAEVYEGITFEGVRGQVDGGFGLKNSAGIVVYGRVRAGAASEIGLLRYSEAPIPPRMFGALTSWIVDSQLLLTDWCRVRTAGSGTGEVQSLLSELWPVAGQSPGRIFLGI